VRVVIEAETYATNRSFGICVGANIQIGRIQATGIDDAAIRQIFVTGDWRVSVGIDESKTGNGLTVGTVLGGQGCG
jgi:hypothetical protein